MKHLSSILLIFGLATMFAFSQTRETRTVSGFTGINASSVFDITVYKGNAESLVIESDSNIMQYVRSEVRDGVLHLFIDRNFEQRNRNIRNLKATITMRDLERVVLSGATKFTSNDLFTPNRFRADLSGASSFSVNVNTDRLEVEASGASNIKINSVVNGNAKLDTSGTSKIEGNLRANELILNSSGVSNVALRGNATNLRINSSGTSNINMPEFSVRTASVNSSGASNLTISVSDALTVNSSGTSSVRYKGSPSINANNNRTSSIRPL